MGDRHGGRFARRGRTLNPHRPQVDAHRGVGFRWRARAKGFVPRRDTPLGENLPTRRTCERICPRAGTRPSAKASRHGAKAKGFAPAQKHAPRRRPPDTAHEQKNLPRARRSPRRRPPDTAHERKDLPAREGSPRRKPPDTAHEPKDLPRAGTRPSAKASRHGARAKGFVPRGSRSPHVPTNGGPPSTDGQPKNTPSAGSHPQRVRPLPSSFTEKK